MIAIDTLKPRCPYGSSNFTSSFMKASNFDFISPPPVDFYG
jgi:hypothetical protein